MNDFLTPAEIAADDALAEAEAKMFSKKPEPEKDEIAIMMQKINAKQAKAKVKLLTGLIVLCLLSLVGCDSPQARANRVGVELVCNGQTVLKSRYGYISFDSEAGSYVALYDPGNPRYVPRPGEQCTVFRSATPAIAPPASATSTGIRQ